MVSLAVSHTGKGNFLWRNNAFLHFFFFRISNNGVDVMFSSESNIYKVFEFTPRIECSRTYLLCILLRSRNSDIKDSYVL